MERPRRPRHYSGRACCPDRGGTVPRGGPSNVDKLAFKYMEMCKVESSTDSESDVSPRWSDTSTMGGGSSTAKSRRVPRSLSCGHKPAGRYPPCHSLSLDPYDGSSEDSDASDPPWLPRRQRAAPPSGAACRAWGGRTSRQAAGLSSAPPPPPGPRERERDGGPTAADRRLHTPPADVQMSSGGSDSGPWGCGPETPRSDGRRDPECDDVEAAAEPRAHARSGDSGMHTTPSPFGPAGEERSALPRTESSSENSSPPGSPLPLPLPLPLPRGAAKRKLGPLASAPGGGDGGGTRKRLCVCRMEAEGESPVEVISDLS